MIYCIHCDGLTADDEEKNPACPNYELIIKFGLHYGIAQFCPHTQTE